MKGVLAALLVVSVVANVWLMTRGGASPPAERQVVVEAPAATPKAPVTPAARAASPIGIDAQGPLELTEMKDRIAQLETELAAAKEEAKDYEDIDPLALVIYSRKPLAWKARKLLEIQDEKIRWSALAKVSQVLAERPETAAEVLAALQTETDPAVLDLLGRFAASAKATADERRAYAELLRSATIPEVRVAAARGVLPASATRVPSDAGATSLAKEMQDALLAAVRTDTSMDVVGEIARSMAAWTPGPDAVAAFRDAAARFAPGPGRRSIWEAVARGSFMGDRGVTLANDFAAATAQEVKDDIAAGIARAANSMAPGFSGTPEERRTRIDDARARFRTVYQGTSDVAVRRSLLRGAFYGLGCVQFGLRTDDEKADAVRFLREAAALEPDATLRRNIEKLAAAVDEKGGAGLNGLDAVLAEK